jgi:hypothetical protein
MTPRRGSAATRSVSEGDAAAYLSKAREFLRAATDALAIGNHVAAASNAVHAGIAGADVIAAAHLGAVWAGEHTLAAGHVAQAGREGSQAAAHLRRLLPLKTRAEYDPRPIPAADARAALRAAERLVALAEGVAGPRPGA